MLVVKYLLPRGINQFRYDLLTYTRTRTQVNSDEQTTIDAQM